MASAAPAPDHVSEAVRRLKAAEGRVAVFLGAGAVVLFGYPLTGALLGQIVQKLSSDSFLGPLRGDQQNLGRQNRDDLKSYLEGLLPGGIHNGDNLPLVTSLLSLLDYSLVTGQSILPSRSAPQIRMARALLERAILEVIADEESFTDESEKALDRFAALLLDLRGSNERLDVITTNYDMASDEAVGRAVNVRVITEEIGEFWDDEDMARKVDFGFSWVHPDSRDPPHVFERPAKPAARLLKLHGSTNWLRCPLCDNVYINNRSPIWKHAYRNITDVSNRCHCSPTKLEAQIVSPSFVRDMREPNLLGIWKNALDVLRYADEWLIIGYSFPDEDLGVRALFTRAYGSRSTHPRITVVQWDAAAMSRYKAFFESERLTYCTGGLKAFLDEWLATGRRSPGIEELTPP